jgi:hypothetical protein
MHRVAASIGCVLSAESCRAVLTICAFLPVGRHTRSRTITRACQLDPNVLHAMDPEALALASFKAVLSKQESEESRSAGLAFTPRLNDVMIVTPPKCGTTLLQQVSSSPSAYSCQCQLDVQA